MKILSFLIICLGFNLFTYSQSDTSTINKVDTKGFKQGYWKKVDEKGILKYEGNFKNNIPVGEFKYYNDGGNLAYTTFFFNNGKQAFVKNLYANGNIMSSGYYREKQKDSIWKFYNEDGALLKQESYKNNLKQGLWLVYSKDTIVESATWNNNQLNGSFFIKRTSYTIHSNYKNGLSEGVYKEVWNNGKTKVTGKYTAGKKNEIWVFNNNTGIPIKTEKWDKDNLIERFLFIPTGEKVQKISEGDIAYFYGTSGSGSIIVLNSGDKVNATISYYDLFDMVDLLMFMQINKEMKFVAKIFSITDFIEVEDGYQIILKPACSFSVYADKESTKAIKSLLSKE